MFKSLNKEVRKIQLKENKLTEPLPCDVCGTEGNNRLAYYHDIGMTMREECFIDIGEELVYNKRKSSIVFSHENHLLQQELTR